MNGAVIGKLIWKDWYLHRLAIGLMLGGTMLGVALFSIPGDSMAGIGASLVMSMFIALAFYLPLTMVLEERSGKTLSFVMSLPVSPAEYAASKILANLILFLVPWSASLLGGLVILSRLPRGGELSGGYLPVLLGGIVVLFSCILSFAIITESVGWTVALIVTFMFVFGNVVTQLLPRLAGFAAYLEAVAARGPAFYSTLAAEFASVLVMTALTFHWQVRKRDFL